MGAEGILVSKIGVMGMPYAKKFNIPLPGGVKPEEFDFFHEALYNCLNFTSLHSCFVRNFSNDIRFSHLLCIFRSFRPVIEGRKYKAILLIYSL